MPWHPSFSTDLPDLDAQHQYFVHLLDRIDVACQLDHRAEIGLLLSELSRYAHCHFACEETLMKAYDFHSEAHLEAHHRLLARLDEMLHERPLHAARLRLFVYNWLLDHIQLDDVELAKFILERRRPFLQSPVQPEGSRGKGPRSRVVVMEEDPDAPTE